MLINPALIFFSYFRLCDEAGGSPAARREATIRTGETAEATSGVGSDIKSASPFRPASQPASSPNVVRRMRPASVARVTWRRAVRPSALTGGWPASSSPPSAWPIFRPPTEERAHDPVIGPGRIRMPPLPGSGGRRRSRVADPCHRRCTAVLARGPSGPCCTRLALACSLGLLSSRARISVCFCFVSRS